ALELADDLRHHLFDALRLDRPLAQRDLHRTHELVAVERHAPSVALDDHELAQLHALESGETKIAGQAHASAADGRRILGRTRILALGVEMAAVRATDARNPRVVDWNPRAEPPHFLPHHRLDGVPGGAAAGERIEQVGDHVADLAELGDAEAARGAG